MRIGRLGSCGCVSCLGALRGVGSDVMRCVGLSQIDLVHHVPQERLIQSNFPSISKPVYTIAHVVSNSVKWCNVLPPTGRFRCIKRHISRANEQNPANHISQNAKPQ